MNKYILYFRKSDGSYEEYNIVCSSFLVAYDYAIKNGFKHENFVMSDCIKTEWRYN